MKKVLLVIIDALTSRIVQSELKKSTLPNMQALIDAGEWRDQCTAIFPSLTLAATPSIATGTYPKEHGVTGAYWYDKSENRIVYLSGEPWMVMRLGAGTFLQDFLVNLNHKWLSAKTIFERVEQAEKTSASLNWFVYHGIVEHTMNTSILGMIPNAPKSATVFGPSTLHLGGFTNHTDTLDDDTTIGITGHPFNRFGFTDVETGHLLTQLAEKDAFSDFTLAYFPDNDFKSHKVGPKNAAETLHKVDEYIGNMIDAYGGLDQFLSDMAVIITGDHSQSDIVDNHEDSIIDLKDLLDDFHVSEIGKGWVDDEDIIICPNGRAACIYLRNPTVSNTEKVIHDLLQEKRIDQVICRSSLVNPETDGYQVFTQDRGNLWFNHSQNEVMAHDHYGCGWQWSGDLSALGKTDQQDGIITFEDYPNAFERVSMLLDSEQSGDIWLTAHLGHDFIIPGLEAHTGGGSHGSLHVFDSSSPLIIAGHPDNMIVPDVPRSVDLVPMAMEILELSGHHPVGESHVLQTR